MSHNTRRPIFRIFVAVQVLLLLTLHLAANSGVFIAHGTVVPDYATVKGDQAGFPSGELIIGLGDQSREALQSWVEKWNGVIVGELPEINAFLVRIDQQRVSAAQGGAVLQPVFGYIQPNYYVRSALTPNDPLWPSQWYLAQIHADSAWNIDLGKYSVIAAVIDTGIDYTHEDLAGNYLPTGHDWVNHDSDPFDDSFLGHGTHVAGILGAVINNHLGIAGMAQVSVMAEKVLDPFGSGTVFDVANGVIDSVQKGARITVNSYGTYAFSQTMKDAFDFADQQGVLNFAAAGNDNTNAPFYPAALGNSVISVAGTDPSDAKASFSNFGDWIELSAPGVNIISTIPPNGPNKYTSLSGTSTACPIAAGAAALIWSHDRNLSSEQVRERLRGTAIDLGTPGHDPLFGYGRIDLSTVLTIPVSVPARNAPVGGTIEQSNTSSILTFWIVVVIAAVILSSSPILLRCSRSRNHA